MIETSLRIYFWVNVVVALAYVLIRLAEAVFRSRATEVSQAAMLRAAQTILLAAILGPIFWSLIPSKHLPKVSFELPVPYLESEIAGPFASKKKNHSHFATSGNASASLKEDHRANARILEVALLILVSGAALKLIQLSIRRKRVTAVVLSATPLKKVKRVSVTLSNDYQVPFSTLFRGTAWVVIPESMLGAWTDLKLSLAHELQHHRQRDTAWAIAIELLTSFLWMNPAIYAWKRRISEIQELACDENLIGRKVTPYAYASCLVRVAEAALENRQVLAGTAGMAAGFENPTYFKSFLRKRIEMLPQHQVHKTSTKGWIIGTVVVCLSLTAAMAAKNHGPDQIAIGTVTTDANIQKIAETAIAEALKRHRASRGFVVVSDPNTGRVLAVANKEIRERKPSKTPHWALSLKIGPASLSKVVVGAAALEEGVTSLSEIHNCEKGTYTWGGKTYEDWSAFERLSTADTIIQSSNICGIKVGQKLGAEGVANAFKKFGFGPGGTAEDFPEARPGQMPSPTQYDENTFIATFSTGYSGGYVTPIEVVQAFGAIANGGNLLRPQSSQSEIEPQVIRRVLTESHAAEMKKVLAEVMTRGTAKQAASKMYHLAGKTATGYSPASKEASVAGESKMAAFAGFGPVDKPRVTIFVVVENPTDVKGVHGSYHAAPVFTEVAEKTLAYLGVPPDSK